MSKPKMIARRILDRHVMAVAYEGMMGDWTAYISNVHGYDYDAEMSNVLNEGTKLKKEIAEVLFPDFVKAKLTWRY